MLMRSLLNRRPSPATLTASIALLVALGAMAIASVVFASGSSIHVRPHRVEAGHRVHVGGVAHGCPRGDQVTLLSRAFSRRHEFAGVPAAFTHVRRGGKFGRRVRIPAHRAPGRYAVRARCGGGNLGVTAHLRVLAP